MTEHWVCPNATPDGEGEFRCEVADRAHQEELSVFDLERVTNPIWLHLRGIGEGTRCSYRDSRLHHRCFGSLVSPSGLNSWINFAKEGKGQVVLRGNEEKAARIFGEERIESIRKEIAKIPIDLSFVIVCHPVPIEGIEPSSRP